MKLCPLCQYCYEDRFTSCAHDQATLIGGRPGACLVAQKYSLDRLLVSGGAQAVYSGRRLETDRPYAIKLLRLEAGADAEALKNFRREALATAHLNTRFDHQHAAKTYDYGLLPDGTVYVTTELITGQSLRQYMDEAGPLPVATAVRIAQQVADGLEAAHRCGVVHYDLEPANIILARDYFQQLEAKIVDFGFASLLKQWAKASDPGASGPERADGPVSPYVAPERRTGQNTDARSDIYSLGVILYEMLAGRLPFVAGAATAVGHDDEAGQLPLAWLRYEMPEPLAQLLTQQLHSRPAARPLSAADVSQRLRAVGNVLAPGYAVRPAEGVQASAADESRTPILSPASDRLPTPDASPTPIALPTAELHAPTYELENDDANVDDANVAAYDDLDSLQEQLGKNPDESIVTAPATAKFPGRATQTLPLTSIALSALPFVARSRAGAIQPKAAGMLRRARPLYVTLVASLILGLAGGLWVASQHASVSPPATSQATSTAEAAGQTQPGAFTKTSSVVETGEPFAGDVSSTPASAEKQSTAATPGTVDERATRRALPVDEPSGQKELEGNPPTASELRRGKAASESSLTAGRGSEQRQGGGPCRLLVSERSLSIRAGGGSDTITVSAQSGTGPAPVTATTKNWPDIAVFPESRGDKGGPVKYSVISVSKRVGTFAVNFQSPCGMKTVPVSVRQP